MTGTKQKGHGFAVALARLHRRRPVAVDHVATVPAPQGVGKPRRWTFRDVEMLCRARTKLAGKDPDARQWMMHEKGTMVWPNWMQHLADVEKLLLPTWPAWKRVAYRIWVQLWGPGGPVPAETCPHGVDWDHCPDCCH